MNAISKFLAGAAATVALGVLGIHASVLPGSRDSAVAKVKQRVDRVVDGQDAEWANYEVDGQKISLTGETDDADAVRIVRDSLGGGLLTGPVTIVDVSKVSVLSPPPVLDPHIWTARRRNGVLTLNGATPSQQARDAVYQLAAMRFADTEISGSLDIWRSEIDEDTWLSGASIALQALARLENGSVEIRNERISASGDVIDAAQESAIGTLLASSPAPFVVAADITIAPPALTARATIDPAASEALDNAGAAPLSTEPASAEVADPPAARVNDCLEVLSAVAAEQRIGFGFGETDPDAASRTHLAAIAARLVECPSLSVTIVGHTDSRGAARRNEALSLYRADAVAAYLRSLGVGEDRLATSGAGESAPVATNATIAGRAQNRRIEFQFDDNQPD